MLDQHQISIDVFTVHLTALQRSTFRLIGGYNYSYCWWTKQDRIVADNFDFSDFRALTISSISRTFAVKNGKYQIRVIRIMEK